MYINVCMHVYDFNNKGIFSAKIELFTRGKQAGAYRVLTQITLECMLLNIRNKCSVCLLFTLVTIIYGYFDPARFKAVICYL